MQHFAMCKQPTRLTPSKTTVYKKAAKGCRRRGVAEPDQSQPSCCEHNSFRERSTDHRVTVRVGQSRRKLVGYAALMYDHYPPFRLDLRASDPFASSTNPARVRCTGV